MADFKIFEPILLAQEGGWCNKPGDNGGETWEGIAYNYFHNWPGWPIISRIKSQIGFPASGWTTAQVHALNNELRANGELDDLVDKFYECAEWDAIMGDQIENQSIANFLADWGVNAGMSVPVKHAQQILNLPDDGKMGPLTLAAINAANGRTFFTQLQAARKQFYLDIIAAHPSFIQFKDTWMTRTASFKYS
jgi:lysozyme family protein